MSAPPFVERFAALVLTARMLPPARRWNAITSDGPVIPPKKQADINIFTVASGLLYEVRPTSPARLASS